MSKVPAVPTLLSAEFLTEVRPGMAPPPPAGPEIAIAGRSNVGKSTLVNRLTGRRALARISKTPGRTRGIMFYELGLRWPGQSEPAGLRLVDLPGYGYAQVSKSERESGQPLVERYVEGRKTLALFVTLIDARRGLGDEENQLIEWLDTLGVPQRLVVTKVDKLSAALRGGLDGRLRQALPAGSRPPLLVSGETGEGIDRLWLAVQRATEPPADVAGRPAGPE